MRKNIARPKEKYLWKFIDLYKFIKFLKTKEMYFSSLNDFDDLYEFTSEDFVLKLKEAHRIADIPDDLRNPKIDRKVYTQYEHAFLALLESLKKQRKDRYVNCFFASDYESLAMWQLYSGIQGVAIRFDSNSVLDYVECFYSRNLYEKYALNANYVTYKNVINIDFYDDSSKPVEPNYTSDPFVKDNMYKHENEYRIMIMRIDSYDVRPIIKINKWDDIAFEIFVFSDLENWKIEAIQNLLDDYGLNKKVMKSETITKKLVDKYKNKFVEEAFRKLI